MINETKISQAKYLEILNLFPVAWHDRLKIYTAEELYYVYRICAFKPSKAVDKVECVDHGKKYCRDCAEYKTGDITFLALRVKLLNYLKGKLNEYYQPMKPIYPSAFAKLGRRFKHAFEDNVVSLDKDLATELSLAELATKVNAERVA